MSSPRGKNNYIRQSGMNTNIINYAHQHMAYPVLGIVTNVFTSDDPLNSSAKTKQDLRGSHNEAEVLVINNGSSTFSILPRVMICPTSPSGADNFHEELPKPCTNMLDGSPFNSNLQGIDITKLNGDFCIVSFIGGSINMPFISNWWPHPFNRQDSITTNTEAGHLKQGPRYFKRVQGTKVTVTTAGSVFVDTNEANSELKPGTKIKRKKKDAGGDIQIDIKKERKLEINFNTPVDLPITEPSLPQTNPPQGERTREDLVTKLLADKDVIKLIAGKVTQLIGNQTEDSILLGANPKDYAIYGHIHKSTFDALVDFVNDLATKFYAHFHQSSVPTAPTSVPLAGPPPPNPAFPSVPSAPPFLSGIGATQPADQAYMPDSDISKVVKLE